MTLHKKTAHKKKWRKNNAVILELCFQSIKQFNYHQVSGDFLKNWKLISNFSSSSPRSFLSISLKNKLNKLLLKNTWNSLNEFHQKISNKLLKILPQEQMTVIGCRRCKIQAEFNSVCKVCNYSDWDCCWWVKYSECLDISTNSH